MSVTPGCVREKGGEKGILEKWLVGKGLHVRRGGTVGGGKSKIGRMTLYLSEHEELRSDPRRVKIFLRTGGEGGGEARGTGLR